MGLRRQIFNLMVVWLLTGIWHGANFTFIIWGIVYGLLIVFEKITGLPERTENCVIKLVYRAITLIGIILCWVVFRAENIGLAGRYIVNMFNGSKSNLWQGIFYFIEFKYVLIFGIVGTVPILQKAEFRGKALYKGFRDGVLYLLFIVCISYLVKGSYNPFIYFNF